MIHYALAFGAIERMLNVAQKWRNWRLLVQSNYFDTHIRATQKRPSFSHFLFFNHSNRLSSTPRLACLLLYQWCAFLWHHFYSEWLNWFYAWINICRFLMAMMQHMLSLSMLYLCTMSSISIILTTMVIIFHKSAAVKLHYTDIIVQLHKFENKSTKVCHTTHRDMDAIEMNVNSCSNGFWVCANCV